jgi:hypothetical protein
MSKCCKKLKMEIKLINYLLLTYRIRHGYLVEEGETERERERESSRETGRGWRVESIGSWHSAVSTQHSSGSTGQGVQRSSRLQQELRDCGRKKKGRRSAGS